MHLEGSCYCGAVGFSVEAAAPAPFLRCYCSICRKTGGGGGYAINLGAQAASLEVRGVEHVTVFQATIDGARSPAERRFCSQCGSALWVWDPRWPELVHPFASVIDTPLPVAPEQVHHLWRGVIPARLRGSGLGPKNAPRGSRRARNARRPLSRDGNGPAASPVQ